MRRGVVFLWSLLAAALLTAIGIVTLLFMMQTRDEAVPEPSPTETSIPAHVPDERYEVFVFNATTDESRGTAMQAQLEALGWPTDRVHLPGSDMSDFAQTTLVYADASDEEYARSFAAALGISRIEQSDAYTGLVTNPEVRPIAIVVGADDEPSAE